MCVYRRSESVFFLLCSLEPIAYLIPKNRPTEYLFDLIFLSNDPSFAHLFDLLFVCDGFYVPYERLKVENEEGEREEEYLRSDIGAHQTTKAILYTQKKRRSK